MRKRCSRSKACGAGCISNAKACRLNFPTAVNNILNKASDQVGVVELYRAAAGGGKRGGAAQFERIRKELRQDLGRNIRAGEDARELKRRLVAAGVIPARGAKPESEENAGQIFQKAVAQANALPSTLKQQLNQLASKDQQEKIASKPDALYGGWGTNELAKFRNGFANLRPDVKEKYKETLERIDQELDRRRRNPTEQPLLVLPTRQLDKSPGAQTRTVLPPKKAVNTDDLFDDISSIMRGGPPQNKSQVAQLQSVLGLGAQTRKEVGRDLRGLIDEAQSLRFKLGQEIAAKSLNNPERAKLVKRLTEVEAAIKGPPTMATGNVRYAREDARDHDGDMLTKGISRELGNKSYRWEDSYGSGTSLLGKGAYGTVLREPNKGNAIKRGEIGQIEADLIDRLGKVDLGPKLLAAQLDGDSPYNKGTKIGRVAMGVVAGSPIGRKAPDKEIGGVKIADAYWVARANLHRLGIAHNDMHIDNVLVDRKGKARFVDLGLAQDSPKAALAEAMGAFMKPQGAMVSRDGEAGGDGDWQMRRWSGTGGEILNQLEWSVYRGTGMQKSFQKELEQRAPVLARIRDNKAAVVFEMKRDGFTLDDVATIIDHGIRSPLGSYERGSWGKMSNEQAQKYINLLYEGIE